MERSRRNERSKQASSMATMATRATRLATSFRGAFGGNNSLSSLPFAAEGQNALRSARRTMATGRNHHQQQHHQRPTPLQYLPLDVKIRTQHTQHPSSLLRVLYLLLVLFNADPLSFLFLAFFLPDPGAAPKVNAWEAPTDIPSWKEEHVSETHPTLLPHATCIFLLLSKT